MNFKKIIAFVVSAITLIGCSSNIYDENGIKIYSQNGKKIYQNFNENFEMACDNNWDIKINEDDYLAKFIFDTGDGNVWLGVRREPLDKENETTDELLQKYTKVLKDGIVKSAGVTMAGKKGKWIKVEPIDGSGIGMKNEDGQDVKLDDSNVVTNDETAEREDLIFVSDDKFAYVFLFHADNVGGYTTYEANIDEILASFKFISTSEQ